MTTKLISEGDRLALVIPHELSGGFRAGEDVEIEASSDGLKIRPLHRHPREGWAEAALRCHENGDDKLLWPEIENDFDKTEWEW